MEGRLTPRPRSKRDLASDHLEHALSECAQALSKLGGRVRHGSKKLPPEPTFTARQYLEGIISRLGVVKALIDVKDRDFIIPITKDPKPPTPKNVRTLDSFERDYDSTRNPQC